MDLSDMDGDILEADIEEIPRDAQARDEQAHGSQSQPAEALSHSTRSQVVDLTIDSDDDSDIRETFPKSKSIVGSDTDNEADEVNNAIVQRPHEINRKTENELTSEAAAGEEDSDDEELRLAVALSLEGLNHDVNVTGSSARAESETQKPTDKPTGNLEQPQGILGMNRKQMEQERLARLAKRKAGDSVSVSIDLDNDQADESVSSHRERLAKVRKTNSARASESGETSPYWRSSSRPAPSPHICDRPDSNHPDCKVKPVARPVPQFPLGAIKKTSLGNAPRSNDDITIEEVLQRGDLELAVLSSFLWDMEWLFTKMDTSYTRFILMMHAKEKSTQSQYQQETASMTNLRLCFPPMEGNVNCMHSKLMLLFHPDYLRIAIPTANLTATDWGENNLMENTVFLIDLPKKGTQLGCHKDSETPFYEELVYFLKATTLHENIIKKMGDFDFSKTARYAFVHTIGGPHQDEPAWRRTGYPGLGRAVTNLGLRSATPVNIEYVTSSVGSLNDNFVRAMHYACKGDDGLTDYILRNDKNPFMAQTDDPNRSHMLQAATEWKKRLRVYFPSDETVRAAHSNPERTAGTICFQKRWYTSDQFPNDILRDCESERGVLMHNKLIFVWPEQPIILRDKTKCTAWVYVGSANFSESAWGRLVKGRTTKKPHLNCRNWECGVVVPVTSPYTPEDNAPHVKSPRTSSSENIADVQDRVKHAQTKEFPIIDISSFVPVPMKMPARTYSDEAPRAGFLGERRKLREPWFFMD